MTLSGDPDSRDRAIAAEGDVLTAGDLTADHHGWYLRVSDPDAPAGRRYFTLGKGFGCGVRHYTPPSGVAMVGLTDDQRSPGIVGTERAFPASAQVELIRKPKRGRSRRA